MKKQKKYNNLNKKSEIKRDISVLTEIETVC